MRKTQNKKSTTHAPVYGCGLCPWQSHRATVPCRGALLWVVTDQPNITPSPLFVLRGDGEFHGRLENNKTYEDTTLVARCLPFPQEKIQLATRKYPQKSAKTSLGPSRVENRRQAQREEMGQNKKTASACTFFLRPAYPRLGRRTNTERSTPAPIIDGTNKTKRTHKHNQRSSSLLPHTYTWGMVKCMVFTVRFLDLASGESGRVLNCIAYQLNRLPYMSSQSSVQQAGE